MLIFAGALLLAKFHWILYVFGAFLLLTGVKMLLAAGKAPGPESSLLKLMGTAVQQTLSELALEVGAEQAWPWHPQGALAESPHAHSMERYAFLRAATIYGGSNEVQRNIVAQTLLA